MLEKSNWTTASADLEYAAAGAIILCGLNAVNRRAGVRAEQLGDGEYSSRTYQEDSLRDSCFRSIAGKLL